MDALVPEDFGLMLDPSTRVESGGRMLLGGSPFRIVTLSDDQAAALVAWRRGEPVGANEERRRFARALVASNLAQPRPSAAAPAREAVDVVVPVRDRPCQLRRLLRVLTKLPDSGSVREVIVADDASYDQDLTARIADDGRAWLVQRAAGGGVSAARNSGAAATAAPFIVFIDSDCVPEEGWLAELLPHFADPLVGAVAPRIVGLAERGVSWLARYEDIRSPLDRGSQSARVLPGSRVPFVPGAALVIRRAALGAGFDETLDGGEDVDFVWRLTEQGWHVRYEPAGRVRHEHRTSPGAWLSRRAYYGRTAAPLARRHHGAARPLAVSPWTAAGWAAVMLRRPVAAAVIVGTACTLLARELSGIVEQPVREAVRLAGGGSLWSGLQVADALNRTWWPAGLAAAILAPRLRLPLAAAALAPALWEWRRLRPPLDPVRWMIARLMDDASYGWGVWSGCWSEREWDPLRPDLGWRLIIETGDQLVAATQKTQPYG